jgi:hypothetical protein
MSEIGKIRGCMSEADAMRVRQECERLLGDDELVDCAALMHGDLMLFTNWRLLLVERDRLHGKEVEYTSIPYHAVVRFSVEAAGALDFDAEVKIWTSSRDDPIRLQFSREVNVYDFQVKLAQRVGLSHLG